MTHPCDAAAVRWLGDDPLNRSDGSHPDQHADGNAHCAAARET
jgi:hypothetical protein